MGSDAVPLRFRKEVIVMLIWETPDFVEILVNCECTAYAAVQ